MTKKKSNRQKHQKDVGDTSEEELKVPFQGKVCSHVPRAVNFGRVKKLLKVGNLGTCNGCASSASDEVEDAEVWLCLQCGYLGCGRMSTNKHMLQHFKTIHSDCHSLVLSPSSGVVWCYDCDDEVHLQSSRNLKQCVEFILKMKTNSTDVPTDNIKTEKSSSAQPSLIETVLKEQATVSNGVAENVPKKTESKKDLKVKAVPTHAPVKGLKNLGNTCFFNAVMQNLSQTALLFQGIVDSCSCDVRWEVPQLMVAGDSVVEDSNSESLKLDLPHEFQLVNNFLKFLKQMSSESKTDIVNPTDLFNEIQKKSPQFQHFHQQDSHELLRQFLDGIRQEEVKRQRKAILKHFNIGNANAEISDDVRKLIKAYGCYASHTIVEKVFGGLLISTVLCEECKMSSQIFEPFMDMSLPLFEEKQQESCDQLCPLLDGGKQEDVKVGRIRKTDIDIEDNEYVLNKSKKDYSKPSKHQEKKMKMLEKKEKKRNKKALNAKKSIGELDDNTIDPEPPAPTNFTIDQETGEQSQICEEIEELITLYGPENLKEEDNSERQDDSVTDVKKHSEIDYSGVEISSPKELCSPDSDDLEPLVLFDEVVVFNNESVDSSSPSVENVSRLSDKDLEDNPEVSTMNNSSPHKVTVSELAEELEKIVRISPPDPLELEDRIDKDIDMHDSILSTNVDECDSPRTNSTDLEEELEDTSRMSPADPLELEERMHALSMQVREVRIRKDSDRQDSILSSSSSVDECESPKTNYTSDGSLDNRNSSDRDEAWGHNLSESQTKEWILKSLTTLQPKRPSSPMECSVTTCLSHFTKPELLTGNNKFRCENCSEIKRKKTGDKKAVVYSNASKQLLIFSPPAVLTLHLKRFQQVGMSLRKVNRFVEFPLVLDLAPYCSSACLILPHMSSIKDEKILYSLYGIVEHSGRLTSGHYTAYVKVTKRTMHQEFMNHLPLAQCDLEQLLHKFSKSNSQSNGPSLDQEASKDRRWYYISDGMVKESSESQVLKCQAYLLFYERIK